MKKKKYNYRSMLIISTLLMCIYFIWRIFFTLPWQYGIVAMGCAIILLICELLSAVEAFIHMISSVNPVIPPKPVIPDDMYPDVDIFIATHNESAAILYKTINGCKHMRYPDKSKVHIWIADDGYRQEMKELAEKMQIGWLGLENNKLAKAGNLNNALSKTSAPLVATFDADMIPTRNFLLETVPYFLLPQMILENGKWRKRREEELNPEDKIGFIQTPQAFYNPDLFQYNLYAEDRIPNEQDYFFREINVSRNRTNSPIYAGSNTLISRQALSEVGGIATGTITEDFETGLHIQGKGYKCYAIDKVVAHGLAPDTIDSLIKQRERWGRGCIFSLRKMHILTNKEIPFASRISYFSCELYWWTFLRRFVFILCPILFSVFSIPVMECKPWELLVFWFPAYFLFNKVQQIESGDIRTTRWSNIIDTVLFPYLIIPIFLEAIGIKKHQFVVTRKDRVVEESSDAALALPQAILLVFSFFAMFSSLRDLIAYGAVGSVIIIYWVAVNGYSLLMAIFFMLGRRNMRMTERYKISYPVRIEYDGMTHYGQTLDVSEAGMAVIFDQALFQPKKGIHLSIKTHHYEASMTVESKYVDEYSIENSDEKTFRYSFEITDIDDRNKAEYYQIVYDREPSLPEKTDVNDSIFDEISSNIAGRVTKVSEDKRRLYRINVNSEINDIKGNSIYMYDFSYRYTVLKLADTKGEKNLTLVPAQNVNLSCEFIRNIDEERALYKITNGREEVFDDQFKDKLNEWIMHDTELSEE